MKPPPAVTVTVTTFRPADRFTWWPSTFASASCGAKSTFAASSLAVADTVACVTELSTPTSYDLRPP